MKNVVILGAGGQIAKHVIDILMEKDDVNLTLFLRDKSKLRNKDVSGCRIVEGDVLWFTGADEVDYETTRKGEPERGSVISQKSLAALITKIIESPDEYIRENLGVNRPNS